MTPQKAIIIGSGIAGIATAIRLRTSGYDVDVFEANAYPGGKLTEIRSKGFRFDAGPSLFTLPHLVTELFELAGKSPAVEFPYTKLDRSCHYFWNDDTRFTAWADKNKMCSEMEANLGVPVKEVQDHLKLSERMYKATSKMFMEKSLHKLSSYLSSSTLDALLALPSLHLTRSLDQLNQQKLSSPKATQVFNRYATYNGSSPYKTPGVMHVIPHLEHNVGTFFPKNGMHQITQSLVELAKELGVNFYFGQKVKHILTQGNKVTGIQLDDRNQKADLVISNSDVYHTYHYLLPDQPKPTKTLEQERSSSALIFYWGINKQFPELDLHNILFADDYEAEFDHIFDHKELYPDPTIYINITSKHQPDDAPAGCENWFVMINVAAKKYADKKTWIDEARSAIIAKVNRILKVKIEDLILTEEILDPELIESRTSSHLGALYGSSSNNRMAAFLRHPNFSQHLKGLYFVGGSVHPGGGIPLCLLSAKITHELIAAHK